MCTLAHVPKVAEMVAGKNVHASGVEIGQIATRMLRGRFWFENQDFGVSFGAICIIFRATSFPTSPGSQNRLFRKIAPGVQGRRNGRGQKMFKLLGRKNCSNFWGPNPSKLSTNVARPILAPESRFWGIRWGNLHHFSRSICSDRSWGLPVELFAPQARSGED